MSDSIHHNCGVSLLRLRKPLWHYYQHYGSIFYALERLFIMMHKQYNRGQDGAGVASVKIGLPPGTPYMDRRVSLGIQGVTKIFEEILFTPKKQFRTLKESDMGDIRKRTPFLAELLMSHLRYGTYGGNTIETCHPFVRSNNWRVRNLAIAANFNLTNNDALFDLLLSLGQHPVARTDSVMSMEKIGHFVDEEVGFLYEKHKNLGDKQRISQHIEAELNMIKVLEHSCADFDGGYVFMGILGHGAAFVARDPIGIRPAYYYIDEEVIAAASERPALHAAFGASYEKIHELPAAHALCINARGDYKIAPFAEAQQKRSCTFERIYFSRASDPAVYAERKSLGRYLAPTIMDKVEKELPVTVFGYIPSSAEVSFMGLIEGLYAELSQRKQIQALRIEKLIFKDLRLRTFITEEKGRGAMVENIYDATCDFLNAPVHTLVVMDDSIVRCTTLERSILHLLLELKPKRIIIVSSAPQVRYPDCYGIDLSRLGELAAFRAAIELLKDQKKDYILQEVQEACLHSPENHNPVQRIYACATEEAIAKKMGEMIAPKNMRAKLEIVFQRIEDLHKACPQHQGDWYFTGNYPTKGGHQVVKKSFLQFMKGKHSRAY